MKIEFGTKALKFLSKIEKGNKERVFKKTYMKFFE